MNRQRIDHCIEVLCNDGCRQVWHHIRRLESGDTLPETESLTDQERQAVLAELKAVMAVYGEGACMVDPKD